MTSALILVGKKMPENRRDDMCTKNELNSILQKLTQIYRSVYGENLVQVISKKKALTSPSPLLPAGATARKQWTRTRTPLRLYGVLTAQSVPVRFISLPFLQLTHRRVFQRSASTVTMFLTQTTPQFPRTLRKSSFVSVVPQLQPLQ